mmetsp:Transcript_32676/g.49245  ORF Transcript_32676/g.49245 Transcript_32676/m.49245 type:complete len:758 (-) Transcript_32676:61-2334(-)
MWPFVSSKRTEDEEIDEESIYTEEEYEEEYEYEVEVTDDEYESLDGDEIGEDSNCELQDDESEGGKEIMNEKDELVREVDIDEEDAEEEQVEEDDPGREFEAEDQSKSYSESEDKRSRAEEDNNSGDETTDDEYEVVEQADTETEEDNAVTSEEEKHSLLALAAEHDRVDILQSILSSTQPEERATLIDPPQQMEDENEAMPPPLHIAVSFGSSNATTCLLRMGANPSIRPAQKKFQGRTAWELAFGSNAEETENDNTKSWLSPKRRTSSCAPVDMAPSKRQGILHAFTAEALRCIGGDDKERLMQLLESGMPKTMDMGADKNLVEWCREMNAENCLNAIEPRKEIVETPSPSGDDDMNPPRGENEMMPVEKQTAAPLVRRLSCEIDENEMIQNRLEELDTLAAGLSTYLDNLAEEVSVCHGLLLMGNGASALASHVRSLKEQEDFLKNDLQERNAKWASTEQELLHNMHQYKKTEGDLELKQFDFDASMGDNSSRRARRIANNDPIQLKAQLSACENKIRKLRASIADMSEESETAMKEVEKRGLTGGIKLVRKYREEIRQLEFQVSEAKSGDAFCRAKLQLLQELVVADSSKDATKAAQSRSSQTNDDPLVKTTQLVPQEEIQMDEREDVVLPGKEPDEEDTSQCKTENVEGGIETSFNATTDQIPLNLDEKAIVAKDTVSENLSSTSQPTKKELSHSEKVANGHSKALMKYEENHGYMPVDLWQILLRIIGLGRVAVRQNVETLKQQSSTVMIV